MIEASLDVRVGMVAETESGVRVQTETTAGQLSGVLIVNSRDDFRIDKTGIGRRKSEIGRGTAVLVVAAARSDAELKMPPGPGAQVKPALEAVARLLVAIFAVVREE